jgi:hypothetical protein
MSWWDTGNGDDVIGDQPGDILRHSLLAIATADSKHEQPKPTLQELLRAVAVVVNEAPESQLAKHSEVGEIVARLKNGATLSSGRLDAQGTLPAALVGPLKAGLRQIADVYQERWQRPPRLPEWLQALTFVLGYRPEEYVRDGVEHAPESVEVVSHLRG